MAKKKRGWDGHLSRVLDLPEDAERDGEESRNASDPRARAPGSSIATREAWPGPTPPPPPRPPGDPVLW